jgi:hypothetical protein
VREGKHELRTTGRKGWLTKYGAEREEEENVKTENNQKAEAGHDPIHIP